MAARLSVTGRRVALGSSLCAVALCAALIYLHGATVAVPDNVRLALVGGAIAALATGAGTLPVLFAERYSQRAYDLFLGFGGGIMLAATAFSLVVPAIAASRLRGAAPFGASATVAAGIVLGMAMVMLLDRWTQSRTTLEVDPGQRSPSVTRAWLFVGVVAIHNLPEGLAIGVAFAGTSAVAAQSLATGIAIQDIPEGLVVAMALRTVGYGRAYSAALGVASGLVEPLMAGVGAMMVNLMTGLLPWGLALAAGAMLFVICNHVIPEARMAGNGELAAVAIVLGFVLMMVLDTSLA